MLKVHLQRFLISLGHDIIIITVSIFIPFIGGSLELKNLDFSSNFNSLGLGVVANYINLEIFIFFSKNRVCSKKSIKNYTYLIFIVSIIVGFLFLFQSKGLI